MEADGSRGVRELVERGEEQTRWNACERKISSGVPGARVKRGEVATADDYLNYSTYWK